MLDMERNWYLHTARKLIAERGPEAAQRVADYQRRTGDGLEFYADIIEGELKEQSDG
jgi:hypothetical protein